MSYVVTIKRAEGAPPLNAEDLERLLDSDESLERADDGTLFWKLTRSLK